MTTATGRGRPEAPPPPAVRVAGQLVALVSALWSRVGRELTAFGLVGAVAFVVDVGLFNLLRFHGDGLLVEKPLTAKILSTSVATLVAWAGNRWWTYRGRRRPALLRELVLFFAMNGVALVIAVLCLAVSHYVLQLRSPVADNISANIVGVGLGTAFRFVAYRLWVFGGPADAALEAGLPGADAAVGAPAAHGTRPPA